MMNDKAEKEEVKEEPFNYANDFLFLTSKEKREVLKNAKQLLRLQKEDTEMVFAVDFCKKQRKD